MKYRLIFLYCLMLLAAGANAQIGIAPEIGFNLTGLKENGNATDANMRFTGKMGAIIDLPLDSNFYLQPGLFYSMEGQSITDYVVATNYLQLPVNLLYKIGKKGSDRFFVGLGIYAGYVISDKLRSGNNHENLPIGNDKLDDVKPFDFGASARVGREMRNGLFLAGQYSMGFVNTYPGNNFNEKNWVISITIGYIFHQKHKKEITIPTTF